MRNAQPAIGRYYRGIKSQDDVSFLLNATVGDTYTDKGYGSFSSNFRVARQFTSYSRTVEPVVVRTKARFYAMPTEAIDTLMKTRGIFEETAGGEYEFLAPRGSSYRIVRIQKGVVSGGRRGTFTLIDLEFLGSELSSRKIDSAARFDTPKGKPCGKSHIPANHKCGKGGALAPQAAATPAERARRRLLTGAGIAITGALLGTIAKDVFTTGLPKEMVPPKTPPAGLYDNFEPGDLIYQAIEFGGSTRAHYAVYLGKQNGIHQVFDTSTRKVDGKAISAMRIRPIEEAHGRGTSYRLASRVDRGTNKKPTTEQLHKIIEKLQERSFNWNGFEENCETFARAVVNDLPVSTQSSQVSALTKLLTRKLVDANMPKGYTKRSINSNQIKRYVSRVVR